MRFIADLHIHSRYSRATGEKMDIPEIARYARLKGIALVATGDFTHPKYRESLRRQLADSGNGFYTHAGTSFVVNTEVSSIYSAGGRLRRIHNIVFVPNLETAEKVSAMLGRYGKLESDGRPTLSISSYDLLARVLEIDERAFVVPAHIWTPWFSLYGSNSGFDTIEECFGDLSDQIFAVETGLSSDPPMNWRLSALDSRTLISNSDAHSPNRLGREANVFDCDFNYDALREVLKSHDRSRLLFTVEFFPEEGKYHFDGHRACSVRMAPDQANLSGDLCPVCGRRLTIGVLHRVEQLADRKPEEVPKDMIPFRHLVPLEEIVAEALGVGRDTKTVEAKYAELVGELGSEFSVLLDAPTAEIARFGERIAQGIERMRAGDVEIEPGYDGVFGTVRVLPDSPRRSPDSPDTSGGPGQQLGLFGA
ncbi:MAG: endonuclease Q family protein [candidate division WOR-3 bacterium]